MEGLLASPRIFITTDMSILCAYDPKGMEDCVRKSRAWVYDVKDNDYGKLELVRSGRIGIWALGGKGGRYSAKVVQGQLPPDWAPYEKGVVSGFGILVESGQLFVGPGERIPGDGFGRIVEIPRSTKKANVRTEEEGKLFEFPNGKYTIAVHVLDWKHDDKFFDENGEATEQAPPDLALVAVPHEGDLAPPRPCPPLLDFLPKPKGPPIPAVMPKMARSAPVRPEVARPSRTRGPKREQADWKPDPDPLPPPKPGEIRVGMSVLHAQFGEGTVLFIREGFPKVKVHFRGGEEKVDRSELTVS